MRPPLALLVPLLLVACGDKDSTDDSQPDTTDSGPRLDPATVELAGACAMAEDYGGFVVDALQDYSTVSGSLSDGVVPMTVLEEVAAEGDCRALRRNNPFCDPPCAAEEACDFDGACVPYPETRDLGTVRISGLDQPVSMDPVAPGYTYFDTSVGHPAYEPDVLIGLDSDTSPWGPLALHGVGVEQIVPTQETWLFVEGEDLAITWEPPVGLARSHVLLRVTIDQHGSTPISLECSFEDDGEGLIPGAIVELLVTAGVTGFPNGSLARRTVDSAPLGDEGCVELVVSSTRNPDVRVDGFTPCQDDDDCPDGQECDEALEICE
jgi:hypothetical protein